MTIFMGPVHTSPPNCEAHERALISTKRENRLKTLAGLTHGTEEVAGVAERNDLGWWVMARHRQV